MTEGFCLTPVVQCLIQNITLHTQNLIFSFLLLMHSTSVPILAVLERGVHYKGYVTRSFGNITAVISSGPLLLAQSLPPVSLIRSD